MGAAIAPVARAPRRTQGERRAEADARMVDAAVALIAEKGFGGLALGEVAARAGYSATLPVHYYKTKEALIVHVAQRIRADYDAIMAAELADARGLDAILGCIRVYFRTAQADPQKRRAFFMITSEAAVHPLLREQIAALTGVGAAGLARQIREGQRAGEIEPLADPELFGTLILAQVRGAIAMWAVDPSLDLERLATATVGAVLRMLRDRGAPPATASP